MVLFIHTFSKSASSRFNAGWWCHTALGLLRWNSAALSPCNHFHIPGPADDPRAWPTKSVPEMLAFCALG